MCPRPRSSALRPSLRMPMPLPLRLQRPLPRQQRGVTILVTLVLLMVMLLGGLAIARMSEVGTLANGNTVYREAAVQAGEVGINTAFAAVVGLASVVANSGTWYFATTQATDASGMPTSANWTTAPAVTVGNYEVRYVVDRQCTGALPIADPSRQCLTRTSDPADTWESSRQGAPRPEPPTVTQYRVTVRITGPKDTITFVQAMVNRAST